MVWCWLMEYPANTNTMTDTTCGQQLYLSVITYLPIYSSTKLYKRGCISAHLHTYMHAYIVYTYYIHTRMHAYIHAAPRPQSAAAHHACMHITHIHACILHTYTHA